MYNKVVKIAPLLINKNELTSVISNLNGWKLHQNNESIQKDYQLKNFEETWAFLNQIAMRAHLLGHHPEIATVYNKVSIKLSTHDLNGVSDIDIKLAKRIDQYREIYNK